MIGRPANDKKKKSLKMFYLKKKIEVKSNSIPFNEIEDTLKGTNNDKIVLAVNAILDDMILDCAMAPVHNPELQGDEVRWLLGKTAGLMEVRAMLSDLTKSK